MPKIDLLRSKVRGGLGQRVYLLLGLGGGATEYRCTQWFVGAGCSE